jgi:hypothetical protein
MWLNENPLICKWVFTIFPKMFYWHRKSLIVMEYILWQHNHCITTKAFRWLFQSNVYNKNHFSVAQLFLCVIFPLRRMITILHEILNLM